MDEVRFWDKYKRVSYEQLADDANFSLQILRLMVGRHHESVCHLQSLALPKLSDMDCDFSFEQDHRVVNGLCEYPDFPYKDHCDRVPAGKTSDAFDQILLVDIALLQSALRHSSLSVLMVD